MKKTSKRVAGTQTVLTGRDVKTRVKKWCARACASLVAVCIGVAAGPAWAIESSARADYMNAFKSLIDLADARTVTEDTGNTMPGSPIDGATNTLGEVNSPTDAGGSNHTGPGTGTGTTDTGTDAEPGTGTEPEPGTGTDDADVTDPADGETTDENPATNDDSNQEQADADAEAKAKEDAATKLGTTKAPAKSKAQASKAPRADDTDPVYTLKTDTLSPTSATINLFDYWDDDKGSGEPDPGGGQGGRNKLEAINRGHALRFIRSGGGGWGLANQYTGGKQVRPGLVAKTLDYGYPRLSGDVSLFPTGSNTTESLRYLFDPNWMPNTGRQVYANVKNLFSSNDGYMTYNSRDSFAEYDKATRSFKVYNQAVKCNRNGDDGQFFPFTTPENVVAKQQENSGCQAGDLNHFFGMNILANFVQANDGYTDAHHDKHTTFEFSGDDDVWIFIDDVLVADLGGIHSEASVVIDFVTGDVSINGTKSHTLRDAFTEAHRQDMLKDWDANSNTFPNDTRHLLKFYYMERGHNESNMNIRYNLVDIPKTAIYKVDQYGDPLADVAFATYRGRQQELSTGKLGPVEYLKEGTTDDYITWPHNAHVDVETGIVYASDTPDAPILFRPTYVAKTDQFGEILFANEYGAYSIDDLKRILGDEFVLRELEVPDGYRTVADEAVLYFAGELLQSKDPYGTGVWSAPNSLVTATNSLYLVNADGSHSLEEYYTLRNDGEYKSRGTLFAVVQKRNGAQWSNLHVDGNWTPVYGNADAGYTAMPSTMDGVISTAKHQDGIEGGVKYGAPVFTPRVNGMQANLQNLPGFTTQYYTYVEQTYFDGDSSRVAAVIDECSSFAKDYNMKSCSTAITKGLATQDQLNALDSVEYYVAYYWTDGSLADATSANTRRVHSHRNSMPDLGPDEFMGFNVKWGSTIKVPNAENRLIVQNHVYDKAPMHTDGQEANQPYIGSWFAMYSVGEAKQGDSTGKHVMFYWATDSSGNQVPIYLNPDPKRDGLLTDAAWIVDPVTGQQKEGTEKGIYRINQTMPEDQNSPGAHGGDITVTISGETYSIPVARNAEGKRCVKATAAHDDPQNPTNEDGAIYFSKLLTGEYAMRQITAPLDASGTRYGINIAETKIVVADSAIYANAGGDRNGVLVGNGAGYLVKSLNMFASDDDVDETLRWIALLLRTNTAQAFADFEQFVSSEDFDNAPYGTESDPARRKGIATKTTDERSKAMATYLVYSPSSKASFFDYVANEDQNEKSGDISRQSTMGMGIGEGTIRLYADDGWSKVDIVQDYDFGYATTKPHTNYANMNGRDLTGLFSNSTFVDYYNSPPNGPAIFKVKAGTENYDDNDHALLGYKTLLTGATFRVSREFDVLDEAGNPTGEKERRYYSRMGAPTYEFYWQPDKANAYTFTSDASGMVWQNIMLQPYEEATNVDYRLEEVKAPIGYRHIADSIDFQLYNVTSPDTGVTDASVTMIRITGVHGESEEDIKDGLVAARTSPDGMRLYVGNAVGFDIPQDDYVVLPDTGGETAWPLTALGAALILLALSGAKIVERRSQQSRNKDRKEKG
ncbi:hypothetical protein D2E26_1121 [Bifidobacterium dolichotidis]|uniref:Fibro-slime domain-containing protein n=2 Tax=Bifidobacterium dolichotidis TaxID=2306976 RepID=A0A430FQG0_9BIFI|nr:hypothetical protein D2E26_1121 [Bifidobacterium dolichotidis]